MWTEGNEDNSEQGKYRAIPAKHVVAVYEVKSRLTKANVADALAKLDQTKAFSDQLNEYYSCGVIFIDLKENDNNSESIIKELIKGNDVFGFVGGMVLRYEKDDSCTGLISLFNIDPSKELEEKHCKPLAKPIDNLNIYLTEDGKLQIAENGAGAMLVATSSSNWSVSKQYGVIYVEGSKSIDLTWSRSNFSEFCINLVSTLEGLPYNDEKRPSFGRIFDRIERKKAPMQGVTPKEGFPFLLISLHEGGEADKELSINYDAGTPVISFLVEVENKSAVEATISDDLFKTTCVLPGGNKTIKQVRLRVNLKDNNPDFERFLIDEGLEIPYRLVYYPTAGEKEFFAIECVAKIRGNDMVLVQKKKGQQKFALGR